MENYTLEGGVTRGGRSEFQSGVAEGIGKVYDRAGNLIKIQTYKDGSVVSEKIVSSNSE